MIKIQGIDLALNHAGIVELTLDSDGCKLTHHWFVTTKKSITKKIGIHGYYLDIPSRKDLGDDDCFFDVVRINGWWELICTHLQATRPDYVGIEGAAYAYAGLSNRAIQLAEVAGLVKAVCFRSGIRLRVHDPNSIKMFTAGKGDVEKSEMIAAVKTRWGEDFSAMGKAANEDLTDAYAIARLVELEVMLRAGVVTLSDQTPKTVQVFNRVTKTYPIALLGREWISNGNQSAKT